MKAAAGSGSRDGCPPTLAGATISAPSTATTSVKHQSGLIVDLLAVGLVRRGSISAPREQESARHDERGSESGRGADPASPQRKPSSTLTTIGSGSGRAAGAPAPATGLRAASTTAAAIRASADC